MTTVLRVGSATDTGRVRANNQDSKLVVDAHRVYGVADGMGGHRGGEVASAMAVETIEASITEPTQAALVAAVEAANQAINTRGTDDADLRGMGTTLCAIAVVEAADGGEEIAWVNVGDSRIYLFRDEVLTQLSTDHNLVEDLRRDGQLTDAEAAVHPQRNIITRALGIDVTVQVDSRTLTTFTGDRFLMCSDGLFNEVSGDQISATMRRLADPREVADELVRQANEHGGRDNITVVVVDVIDDGGRTAAAKAAATADAARAAERAKVEAEAAAAGAVTTPIAPDATTERLPTVEHADPAPAASMAGFDAPVTSAAGSSGPADPATGDADGAAGQPTAPPITAGSGQPVPGSADPNGPADFAPGPPFAAGGTSGAQPTIPGGTGNPNGPADHASVSPDAVGGTSGTSDQAATPGGNGPNFPGNSGVDDDPLPFGRTTPDLFDDLDHARGKHVTWRVIAFVIAILVVLAVAFGAVGWFAKRTYYVGFAQNQVVVYQGQPGGLLMFKPSVKDPTGVTRAQLTDAERQAVAKQQTFSSLADARSFADNLKTQVAAEQAASTTTTTASTTTTTKPRAGTATTKPKAEATTTKPKPAPTTTG